MLMFYTFFPREEFLFPYISFTIVGFSYLKFIMVAIRVRYVFAEKIFLSE